MRMKEFNLLSQDFKGLIKWIGAQADRYGFGVYIVGGCVRDLLLKKEAIDFDVVVEGDGIEFVQKIAKNKKVKLIIHRQFGTATIILSDNLKVDIATARKEIYEKPAALPKVTPGDIRDDLSRRDFSINTMAIKINKKDFGEFLDYFNGHKDLKNRIVRVLHSFSFIDDPTRILRAIRFEQRFNFRLDRNTYILVKKAVKQGLLNKIQPQRIWNELVLLLKEPQPKRYILRLDKICGLSFIHHKIKLDKSLLKSFDSLERAISWFYRRFSHEMSIDIWLIYFVLLTSNLKMKDIDYIVRKYNIRKTEQDRIYSFVRLRKKLLSCLVKPKLKPSQIFSILEPLSYEVVILIRAVSNKEIIEKRIEGFLSLYNGVRLQIGGKDLIGLGVKPGVYFRDVLKKTLYAKIDGNIKTKSEELRFVKRLIKR